MAHKYPTECPRGQRTTRGNVCRVLGDTAYALGAVRAYDATDTGHDGGPGTVRCRALHHVVRRPPASRRWTDLSALADAGLEGVELGPQLRGELLAELVEPLLDEGQLLLPVGRVDPNGLGDLLGRHVEPVDVDGALGRHEPDRGLHGIGVALEALDDPLEDAAVLAEAGPEEGAVLLVATEPVDAEDAGELGGVRALADLEPVVHVVAGVVADEGQHRHRVAADDTDG